MRFFLCLSIVLQALCSFCFSENHSRDTKTQKKYDVSICALFNNESEYLVEWIEYHKIIGIDHFYIYNNSSTDRSVDVLTPYIREGLVTLFYWPTHVPEHLRQDPMMLALSTQLSAYENASKYAAIKDSRWLLVLDVDEFLVPVSKRSIHDILEQYSDAAAVRLSTNFFCARDKNAFVTPRLVIESVNLTEEGEFRIENKVDKMIFNPEEYTYFTWPPYKCYFVDDAIIKKTDKSELRINKYLRRPKGILNFGKIKTKLYVDNRLISDEEAIGLLKVGYEIEDQERAIFRFVPELKKRMKLDLGWNR